MALSVSRLKAALAARFKVLWRSDPPSGQEQNEDYFLDKFAEAIAEEVIDEFTAFARCSGVDSRGDSHDDVQIV